MENIKKYDKLIDRLEAYFDIHNEENKGIINKTNNYKVIIPFRTKSSINDLLENGFKKIPITSFCFLLFGIVDYGFKKYNNSDDIEDYLLKHGKLIGIKLCEMISFKDSRFQKPITNEEIIKFLSLQFWKQIFGSSFKNLSKRDDKETFLLYDELIFYNYLKKVAFSIK